MIHFEISFKQMQEIEAVIADMPYKHGSVLVQHLLKAKRVETPDEPLVSLEEQKKVQKKKAAQVNAEDKTKK